MRELAKTLEHAQGNLERSPRVLRVRRARCRSTQAVGKAGSVIERPAETKQFEQRRLYCTSCLSGIPLECWGVDAAEPPQVAFGRRKRHSIPVDQAQSVDCGEDVCRMRLTVRDDQLLVGIRATD